MIEILHKYHLIKPIIFSLICLAIVIICFIIEGAYDDDTASRAWDDLDR